MGRRSRKRETDSSPGSRAQLAREARASSPGPRSASTPPGGPPSPRRRPRLSEAPAAPWSPFPLVELCILVAIVLLVLGFATHGPRGRILLACGLTLVTLSALELSIREHFAGYRSHSALLAGACAVAVDAGLFFFTGLPQVVLLGLGLALFAIAWHLLRGAFARRARGLGFRA
ncbi:MAG TPA: hypothetical protein VGN69_11260 [Solirubrobacteraceae bacterium]|nr:hypothetical protein [Solirubrobacteraceae bacterium]